MTTQPVTGRRARWSVVRWLFSASAVVLVNLLAYAQGVPIVVMLQYTLVYLAVFTQFGEFIANRDMVMHAASVVGYAVPRWRWVLPQSYRRIAAELTEEHGYSFPWTERRVSPTPTEQGNEQTLSPTTVRPGRRQIVFLVTPHALALALLPFTVQSFAPLTSVGWYPAAIAAVQIMLLLHAVVTTMNYVEERVSLAGGTALATALQQRLRERQTAARDRSALEEKAPSSPDDEQQ